MFRRHTPTPIGFLTAPFFREMEDRILSLSLKSFQPFSYCPEFVFLKHRQSRQIHTILRAAFSPAKDTHSFIELQAEPIPFSILFCALAEKFTSTGAEITDIEKIINRIVSYKVARCYTRSFVRSRADQYPVCIKGFYLF